MLRLVLLGALASVAFSMNLGGMNLGAMGGLMGNLGNMQQLMKNMPPGAIENAIKNLTPEKINQALESPQVQKMMEGMGISKEQAEQAVKMLPKDPEKLAGMMTEKISGTKATLEGMGVPVDELPQIIDELKSKFKDDFGIDIDNDDEESIVGKLKQVAIDRMKEEGVDIDPEDPEKTKKSMIQRAKAYFGVSPDMDDEEFKKIVIKDVLINLQQQGYDIDPEEPKEAIIKLKSMALEMAKDYGFEINEEMEWPEIKQKIMEVMREKGVPVDDQEKLIPYLAEKFQEYQPLIMEFLSNMQPQPVPQVIPQMMPQMRPIPIMRPMPMQRPPFAMPLSLNLEINIDGDNQPSFGDRYQYGEQEEMMEMLQDLLHYRHMAKRLIAENQMLQHRLMALERPVMSRSPMITAIMARSDTEE
ncbi:uncharacterized protein LOC133172027 [Saccostrea echinata]|uniref:uncharacterized protein LOC133172027 n=1 Tax=Saccostrea echinata TaxID=191078 RepID=UPI002A81F821|nr:uncharacterized protein LOC133172027 [Saccostrea echinata]